MGYIRPSRVWRSTDNQTHQVEVGSSPFIVRLSQNQAAMHKPPPGKPTTTDKPPPGKPTTTDKPTPGKPTTTDKPQPANPLPARSLQDSLLASSANPLKRQSPNPGDSLPASRRVRFSLPGISRRKPAVAPCYTSRPLVRTPLVDDILSSIDDSPESIADEVAGFPTCIAFANFPPNYEDAMMVSQRFVDLGGFSSTSVSIFCQLANTCHHRASRYAPWYADGGNHLFLGTVSTQSLSQARNRVESSAPIENLRAL
jgi:hypothetical protein